MSLKKKILSKNNIIFVLLILALISVLFIVRIIDPRVEFKDRCLEEAIRDALGNQNRPIFKDDLLNITLLDASDKGIVSLDGIEHLHNLTFLNLGNNNIQDVSPLKNLNKLKDLNLSNNSITNLEKVHFDSITGLPLTVLNLNHNIAKGNNNSYIRLTDINLIGQFKQLEELYLRENSIEDVSFLGNLSNLEILDLSVNLITSISPLENIRTLKELNLRDNNIADISPLSELKELEYLNLHSNREIGSIESISNLTNLKTLILQNVNIRNEVEVIGNLKNLERLNIRNCDIADISFIAGLRKLKELNLRYNDDVEDISPLSELKELEYLNIYSNKYIESIAPISNLTNLKTLIMQNDYRLDDVELLGNLTNLQILDMHDCRVSDISFIGGLTRLKELNLSYNNAKDLSPLNNLDNLEILDLSGADISEIPTLKNINSLKELNLRNNNIADISPLSELKELEYLNLHSNREIETIAPIANLTSLKTLIIRDADLGKEIGLLESLVNLKRLNIRNCNVSDISFIARLIETGALQDDPLTGERATIDISDNPVLKSAYNGFESIRPYWQNISTRAPFVLPYKTNELEPPAFSHQAGYYKEGFLLELTIDDPEACIYYTLDGSEPVESSNLYTGLIRIDSRKGEPNILSNIPTSPSFKESDEEVYKVTVVRACAIKDSNIISSIVTHTYIVDENNESDKNRYSLPLISISSNHDNLFGYLHGILVPGASFNEERRYQSGNYYRKGIEWERPIHIEFFEPDGTPGFSQNAGLRIHGNSTRNIRIKAMRIHASDLYDERDMFDYPIFPGLSKTGSNEPLTEFNDLILRNSGNDYNETYLRDGFLQTLVTHLGFDTQAYRPAVVFINGEYWGLYNIRERYNEYYFATKYDVDNSKIVILESPEAVVKTGEPNDNVHFLEMVEFIEKNVNSGKINNKNVYENINTLIDIDNFINYFSSQIFFCNTDWPHHNIGFWRIRTENYEPDAPYGHDGRWRCMMFDTDFGFGLWNQSVKHNTLEYAIGKSRLFSLLLENDEFRYQFINTMADLLNSIFRTEYIVEKIEETKSVIEPEMSEHLKRWNYMDSSIEKWNDEINELINFAIKRPQLQIKHINDLFSLSGTAEINLIVDPQRGYIKINSLELKNDTPGIENHTDWKGVYFKEIPITITAVPYPGYEFSDWIGIDDDKPSITITLEEDLTLTAVFNKK